MNAIMSAKCYNSANDSIVTLMPNQLDELADKVAEKIMACPEHRADHAWVRAKRTLESDNRTRRQKITDGIVGAVGTVGVFGVLGWVGHSIIAFIQDMIARGGPP